ncbi:MAG: TIM barrel protein [Rhizobiaceae bacterium]|nr:TIM barrel protein [Rhizobiaceae bacterium]
MRLIANISMLFMELPLAERLAAAQQAGFEAVEIQFPEAGDIAALQAAAGNTGLPITLINVPRGPGDAVGLAALPGQEQAFRAAVATCAAHAEALGVRKVNVLAGRPAPGADLALCRQVLKDNLLHTADVMEKIGVQVMVEPVNPMDVPGFFLTGLRPALELLTELSHPNLALQFDFYHMARTEPDLCAAIAQAGQHIGHVQFADTEGRHEPGTGNIAFAAAFAALHRTGYDDDVSAEYNPAGPTMDGLGWITDFKRMIT